ncbi:MAG: hypothetical protein HY005_02555 [Candidatus Staskawiczbacteria bacterium]|nr:hypothetical protein [Candidatus Staskawiczbacteria bacterium]MBI3337480.1 hypothetical protein [Candidatus Staskawiczbacteria bacterium]
MKIPKPRKTKIIKSKTIKGLFYEGFKRKGSKKEVFDDDDLVVAFHYNGIRFDLHEFVQIKPKFKGLKFRKIKGQPLLGIIIGIEPDSESGNNKLIIRVNDCESQEQDIFMVTEIKKE